MKRLTAIIVTVCMVAGIFGVCASGEDFTASFSTDGHAKINTYYTADYTTADETDVTSATARNSLTGEADATGEGQINFAVIPDDGYIVDTVTAEPTTAYKNLKIPADTGAENTYRLTKVAGALTVTVTTKKADTPLPEATFTFSDDGISVTGDDTTATVVGTALTVAKAGKYTFTGSCTDGSIIVNKGIGEVAVTLDALTLTSTTTSPFQIKSGNDVSVEIKNSVTLTDADRGGVSPKACMSFSSDATVTGDGTLTVNGNNKNGIKCDGALFIDGTDVTVKSADDGISADASLRIKDSSINIDAGGNALKSDPDAVTEQMPGDIAVSSSDITVKSKDNAIKAGGKCTLSDCFADNMYGEAGAIFCTGVCTVSGGTVACTSGAGISDITAEKLSVTSASLHATVADGTECAEKMTVVSIYPFANGTVVTSCDLQNPDNENVSVMLDNVKTDETGSVYLFTDSPIIGVTTADGTHYGAKYGKCGYAPIGGNGLFKTTDHEPPYTIYSTGNHYKNICANCGYVFDEGEIPEKDNTYTDVKATDWYIGASVYVTKNGYMSGLGDGVFAGNTATSRAMVVKVLYNIAGKPDYSDTVLPFTDVPDGEWYTDAVKWAYANSIVSGMSDTTFCPNSPVTREQFMKIIYGYTVSRAGNAPERAELSAFTDAADVSGWATESMKWGYACGYISGMSETVLSPKTGTTRAQMASIMLRYMK